MFTDITPEAVVRAAATLFIPESPENPEHLQKAMDLVLSGKVIPEEDGTASVTSGNRTYALAPECTCEDAIRRSKYCTHYIAVQLLKRTREQLRQPDVFESTNGAPPELPPQSAQSWQCAQAPSSCTMKVYLSGVEILLTLRDATDVGLFARVRAVLPKLLQKVADAGASTNGTPTSVEVPQCTVHQVPMRQQHKNGQSWWSHFVEGEKRWCKGK